MLLQTFYDLADLMKAEIVARNVLLGINETDYNNFLNACTEVGKLLVDGSQVATYSDGSFNTAVDSATSGLGYDPLDLTERQNGLMVIVAALALPTGVTASQLIDLITEGWANMFSKDGMGNYNVVEAIASIAITNTTAISDGILCPSEADVVQITASKTAGAGSVVVAYAVSADNVSYTAYDTLGTISANEAQIYGIDNVNIPKYIKVKFTATGAATVNAFVSVAIN